MEFTNEQIRRIWEKAFPDPENDPDVYRKDECGAWIARSEYGNRLSNYGWEIDYIIPPSQGGEEEKLSNLRPLMWENKLSRSESGLLCVIVAENEWNVKAI